MKSNQKGKCYNKIGEVDNYYELYSVDKHGMRLMTIQEDIDKDTLIAYYKTVRHKYLFKPQIDKVMRVRVF